MEQNSEKVTLSVLSGIIDLTGKEFLEIGCGDGRLTAWFVGLPASLKAIDPDPKKIDAAKKAIPGVTFQVGSGELLDFSDGSFDVVLFSLSLHHHEEARVALGEAWRVLRPTGVALVLEPLAQGALERICSVVQDEDEATHGVQQVIRESAFHEIKRAEVSAQWSFVDKDEVFHWVFDHYKVPFDTAMARQMDCLPGVDLETRPIVVEDLMAIQMLSKESPSVKGKGPPPL